VQEEVSPQSNGKPRENPMEVLQIGLLVLCNVFNPTGKALDQWFPKWAIPPPLGAVKQKWAIGGR